MKAVSLYVGPGEQRGAQLLPVAVHYGAARQDQVQGAARPKSHPHPAQEVSGANGVRASGSHGAHGLRV